MEPSPRVSFRERFVGVDIEVPVLDGRRRRYVNFDNAASTPPLASVRQGVDRFLDHYASVHRGMGFKSQLSTWAYEQARERVNSFVGADPRQHVAILVKNTTEAINKLARRLELAPDDVVLTTVMEHHSDDLPFRPIARVIHAGTLPDGRLDETDFDRRLAAHAGRVRLVAVTGASNVTGYLNPIHRLARKAHDAGAWIAVDAAQLAPHRAVRMLDLDDPEHLDFVSLSAHKLYAPYGGGALVGRRDVFERGEPDSRGGGTVEIVTVDDVVWSGPPDREEAGSPNVVGAVALALAIDELENLGMETVARHEAELTAYALRRLSEIPGLRIWGDADPSRADQRLGVIPFTLEGMSHFLVAAILGHEFGIGVRSGCFCAHPYVLSLLGLSAEEADAVRTRMMGGDKSEMPGFVRASFGLYNTMEEIDQLVEALGRIARGQVAGRYHQDRASGEYHPEGWAPDFASFFPLATHKGFPTQRAERETT
ncbi:MAG TPA: aminotransferase class V-fold PLP-dependent enzyme [Anaerolineales bacterium]|nr:aminotransferase class V-fold PLP-dependent enzyme [Anaerolineales bacterium]